ncbi:MAG: hypothetical protein RBS99_00915 [Rhodospirillales bacterium]|nr:hypothetical protein [Rhodospirillales bacterium]
MNQQRQRPLVQPSLSSAARPAAPRGLTADPRYRLSVSEPPRERSLPSPRLLISLIGLTGGLVILYVALKLAGVIG